MWSETENREVDVWDVLDEEELGDYLDRRDPGWRRRARERAIEEGR